MCVFCAVRREDYSLCGIFSTNCFSFKVLYKLKIQEMVLLPLFLKAFKDTATMR